MKSQMVLFFLFSLGLKRCFNIVGMGFILTFLNALIAMRERFSGFCLTEKNPGFMLQFYRF